MKVVLTIAGSDSGGGAGIQADLRTFAAHGVHGTSAITAVTAQNSVAVLDWVALEPRMVVAQIEAVASDMPVAAAKTGMLANRGIVARGGGGGARGSRLPLLVVDPVMVAKSGDRLLDADAEARLRASGCFPLATVITPNLPETEALLGRPVRTLAEMREAARDLQAMGPRAVVVKGGHLEGDAVDVFFDGAPARGAVGAAHRHRQHPRHRLHVSRPPSPPVWPSGDPLLEAVRGAKDYLTEAIRAVVLGRPRPRARRPPAPAHERRGPSGRPARAPRRRPGRRRGPTCAARPGRRTRPAGRR